MVDGESNESERGERPPPDQGTPLFLAPRREEDRSFWERWMPARGTGRRKIVVVALGLVVMAAGAGAALLATDWLRSDAGDGEGPAVVDTAAAADSTTRFQRLAATLDTTIREYRTLQPAGADPTSGCESLARRYRAVDDAFVALAAYIRGLEDPEVSFRMEERFQELLGRVEEVYADFDASGCPRPD